ncbi:MAG: hypothetical protein QXP42_05555 [Candidatus Micrarchaeia archaeon]
MKMQRNNPQRALFIFPALLILLSSLSFSADLRDYFKADEKYSLENFGEYQLVRIGGPIAFIIDGKGIAIENAALIEEIISEYVHEKSINESTLTTRELNELAYLIGKFNESRGGELECRFYTGTDRFPCDDRGGCQSSCYTPVCKDAMMGYGWGFLDAVANFSKQSRVIDEKVSKLIFVLRNGGLDDAESASSILKEIRNTSSSLSSNPLFTHTFLFCPSPKYDMQSLSEAERTINNAIQRIKMLTKPRLYANELADMGRERNSFRKSVEACRDMAALSEKNIADLENRSRDMPSFVEISGEITILRQSLRKLEEECKGYDFRSANRTYSSLNEMANHTAEKLETFASLYQNITALYNETLALLESANSSVKEQVSVSLSLIARDLPTATTIDDLMNIKNALNENIAKLRSLPQASASGTVEGQKNPMVIQALLVILLLILISTFAYHRWRRKRYPLEYV